MAGDFTTIAAHVDDSPVCWRADDAHDELRRVAAERPDDAAAEPRLPQPSASRHRTYALADAGDHRIGADGGAERGCGRADLRGGVAVGFRARNGRARGRVAVDRFRP